jgi:hypothetical protein
VIDFITSQGFRLRIKPGMVRATNRGIFFTGPTISHVYWAVRSYANIQAEAA